MKMMAKHTYTAFKEAGASVQAAEDAAAETGEIFVSIKETTALMKVLIGLVLTGFVIVISILVQIALRL